MPLPENWPTALDALADPGPATTTDQSGFELSQVVTRIHNLVEKIEARFGIGVANGTPIANRVYGGTGTGTAGYRQIVDGDVAAAAAIAYSKLALANSITSADIAPNTITAADVAAGALPMLVFPTSVVSGSPAASITFSPIPASFSHLELRIFGRSTAAGAYDVVALRFNGDVTNGNYWGQQVYAVGTSVSTQELSGTTSYATIGSVPGAGAGSSAWFGQAACRIMGYTTGFYKPFDAASFHASNIGAGNLQFRVIGGLWSLTSVVTSITVLPGGGNWAVGTQASLLGYP